MSGHHQGQTVEDNRETVIDEFVRRGHEATTIEDAETALHRIFKAAGVELPKATEELRKIADRMRRQSARSDPTD